MLIYNERKRDGVCVKCEEPAISGRVTCVDCSEEQLSSARRRANKMKKSGCTRCGSPRLSYGMKQCDECHTKERNKRRALKEEVFLAYGGFRCVCCEITLISMLSIDHVKNDGAEHRKQLGSKLYYFLKRNGYPSGYQVLCWNCNWSKSINNGVCEHKSAYNQDSRRYRAEAAKLTQ